MRRCSRCHWRANGTCERRGQDDTYAEDCCGRWREIDFAGHAAYDGAQVMQSKKKVKSLSCRNCQVYNDNACDRYDVDQATEELFGRRLPIYRQAADCDRYAPRD